MLRFLSIRSIIGLIAILCLAYGFSYAKAVHSIGLLLIGIYSIYNLKEFKEAITDKWVMISLIIPLVVLLKDGFINVFFINLSLPLYGVFLYLIKKNNDNQDLHYFIITFVFFCTALNTIYIYLSDVEKSIEGYKMAKVLPIGYYNDHVRTSIAMALSLVLSVFSLKSNTHKILKWWNVFYIVFMLIFIHFLSSRMGLIALYILILVFFTVSILKSFSLKKLIFALSIIIILPIVSIKIFPSFYNRYGYTLYDFEFYKDMKYRPGSSDGVRWYSIKAGIDIFKGNKWTGVGFKGLREKSFQWFSEVFPQMPNHEKMQPHSQYIVYAAAGGIFGLFALILFLFYPLFMDKFITNEYSISILLCLILVCLLDVFLDHQTKLFVLGYFIFVARNLKLNPSLNL